MLANVLANQRAHFATLAKAWLASGASAFGVWSDGAPLAYWPDKRMLDRPSLVVPIYFEERVLGELRIAGLSDLLSQERLVAEAGLVSHLIQLEEDLNTMTAELVESQDRLLAVYQLARSLRHYTTIDDTLRGLLFEAMRLVKTRAGFAIFDFATRDPIVVQYPANFGNEAAIWEIFRQAQVREREMSLTTGSLIEAFSTGADNLCFIPIRIRGSFIAGLGLLNKPTGFSTPDVKLARAIIDQASAHIEQVLLHQETLEQRKIQNDLDLARRVQLRLLPQQLPSVPGLDIAANSRPARQIGGDFYDFIHQPQRPLMFAVGDVSGKALSAALMMTMTRTAIHSKASYMPNPTPELVMRNSNEDLFEDYLQVGMFSTAFIGQYQAFNRTMLYANAGHSPVIYCPVGGTPQLLGADSPPIGVLSTSMGRNHTIQMDIGDVLVVATDGFNEARSPDEELFGYERLLNLVAISSEMSARAIAEILFAAVDAFSVGRPQDDDQTLVVIKGVAV
ncbi:MAG TPA: PP2C family protein-serine/threonine phosphatase [Kouleothrix sp.]|uniref:PP2C family protein-serine/threonine phosphatase n=1 Tax=Kouleothrix sp. TaxID=2779161 RepID=UPI002C52E5D7|nr:PP2C family protein-serine/threonine phosphatase [Kouleothrix sp.]